MPRKVLRFHAAEPGPPAPGFVRSIALVLPGLPAPAFVAVDTGPAGDGLLVDEVQRRPGPRGPFRMLAYTRRNPALARAEFVERWAAEAGRMGGETIPDDVRGLSYVQDVPVEDDPPFDAVNEVWFPDLAGLRRRAEWFAARPVPGDLFDPATSGALYLHTPPPNPRSTTA